MERRFPPCPSCNSPLDESRTVGSRHPEHRLVCCSSCLSVVRVNFPFPAEQGVVIGVEIAAALVARTRERLLELQGGEFEAEVFRLFDDPGADSAGPVLLSVPEIFAVARPAFAAPATLRADLSPWDLAEPIRLGRTIHLRPGQNDGRSLVPGGTEVVITGFIGRSIVFPLRPPFQEVAGARALSADRSAVLLRFPSTRLDVRGKYALEKFSGNLFLVGPGIEQAIGVEVSSGSNSDPWSPESWSYEAILWDDSTTFFVKKFARASNLGYDEDTVSWFSSGDRGKTWVKAAGEPSLTGARLVHRLDTM